MRTREEILTETIKAINPDWDYGKDDHEVFRSLWTLFDPSPAKGTVLKAMSAYAAEVAVEFHNAMEAGFGFDHRTRDQIDYTTTELYELFKKEKGL